MWLQLDPDKAHVAYAIFGISTTIFACVSLFLKERLFIGEATASTLTGIIAGPKALNLFVPTEWGNFDYITQEISRIVLIIQIFAVSVELPKKYMKKHCLSVMLCLFFGMVVGWVVMAAAMYWLFSRLNFADALLISGCITATDPVLAAAIVGKGKFGQRVPAHLRNLLSAESGANDGLAFPFVLLAAALVMRRDAGGAPTLAASVFTHFLLTALLYECTLGVCLGVAIGYVGRQLIKYCEKRNLIDRESFFVFYILLSLICTGLGSILGVDDLLVSFAAGTAFAWDGWFSRKTEETNLSNIVDLLLNMGYFLYFGASIPWDDYNNTELGLDWWRLVTLGVVAIGLKRVPVFLALKPITPDLRTWKEAFFVGHFGPIGVGGLFCSMIAKGVVERGGGSTHEYLLRVLWPVVTFLVVCSVVVHGSSVTVMTMTTKARVKFGVTKSARTGGGEPTEGGVGTSAYTSGVELHTVPAMRLGSPVTENSPNGTLRVSIERQAGVVPKLTAEVDTKRAAEAFTPAPPRVALKPLCGREATRLWSPAVRIPVSTGETSPSSPSGLSRLQRFFRIRDNAPDHPVIVDERTGLQYGNTKMEMLTAYRIGAEVFVEDPQGDVIRRYKVHARGRTQEQGPLAGAETEERAPAGPPVWAHEAPSEELYSHADTIEEMHDGEYDEGEIRGGLRETEIIR